MYKQLLAVAALLSAASVSANPIAAERSVNSNPDQILLGRLGYSHGNQFVAWAPSKTTLPEACKTHANIQTNNSNFPDRPICGSPFSVGNLVNVTLECKTNPPTPFSSDVVAVRDASGKKIENCVVAQGDYYRCDNFSGLQQLFVCTWEA